MTLGDHLRKVRLDKGLSQPQTADSLLVSVSAVRSWEANRFQPEVRHVPRILGFLGYNPLPNGPGWPERLYQARAQLGLTQEQMAKQLGVGHFSYQSWERDIRQPSEKMRALLEQNEQG
ncbi:helix-turn-helix domain-containing protein [Candidatus Sumerlaeota bacterium]|nr:helix-turn-helix domain-containing protein [Candidatus Sumerlaeota bacterium]